MRTMRTFKALGCSLMTVVWLFGAGGCTVFSQSAEAAEPSTEEIVAAEPSNRIESGGFDTPDEAIMAFADALIAGDLDQMISTFAVESYCEHYSLVDMIQRMCSIQPNMIYGNYAVTPTVNDLMGQMSVQGRRASIMNAIKNPLLSMAADKMSVSGNELCQQVGKALQDLMVYGEGVRELSRTQIQEAVAGLQDIPDFSGKTVSGPISMSALTFITENYLSQANLESMFAQSQVAGADGYTERGIILEDEDEIYFVTMSIIRYGDKWYNYQLGGIISAIMGISFYRQGFTGVDLGMIDEGYDVADMDMQDFQGIKNLLAASKISGSSILKEIWDETPDEFDQGHEELIAQLQSGIDSKGNSLDISSIDFSKPLIGQIEALKTAADNSGQNFYTGDFRRLKIMSFDEILEYFALE